ncbi:MFS transporter [Scopulibacillus cellulosilyticus]|uniref:MFS transporter n=1 Tax=Scopulibacillus cellulosilyticus TaxID=2665665 RepID=A0ABW2Q355_9BACL
MKNINARIERIPDNRYNKKLLSQTGLGYIYDTLDGTLLSFVLPVVAGVWALSSQQTGVLGSSLFIGYLFGTLFSGYLADRFGRKKIIMFTLVVYSLATLLSAFATNWGFFFWARVIAGFGTGGEAAIIAPYLSELISSKFRGRYTGLLTGFFAIGNICAGLVSYFIVPLWDNGWRVAIFISALPIFMIIVWRRHLPESPRWLEHKGRYEEADKEMTKIEEQAEKYLKRKLPEPEFENSVEVIPEKTSILTLFSKQYAKRTIMLWLLWFAIMYVNFGFLTWLPTLLVKQGFEIASSFLYSIIIYIAQVPGYLLSAFLLDKIGRKLTLMIGMICAIISALCMGFASIAFTVVLFGACMSCFMTMSIGVIYAYTPEQFPTAIRTTGMGSTSGFSRFGSILAPIVIGAIYPLYGFTGVFIMLTAVLICGALVVLVLGSETKNKSLDEVTEQMESSKGEPYKTNHL